jgi:hypothetical protein
VYDSQFDEKAISRADDIDSGRSGPIALCIIVQSGYELPTSPVLGLIINQSFVEALPYHGEHGIRAGKRAAFGLAHETLPDR